MMYTTSSNFCKISFKYNFDKSGFRFNGVYSNFYKMSMNVRTYVKCVSFFIPKNTVVEKI